jgi:hypothetical protein
LEQYQQQQLLKVRNLRLRKNIDVISRFPRQPSSRLQIHLNSRAKLLQIYLQYDTRLQHCLLVLLSQSKEKEKARAASSQPRTSSLMIHAQMVDNRGCQYISGIFGNRGRETRPMTLDRETKALRRRSNSLSLPHPQPLS